MQTHKVNAEDDGIRIDRWFKRHMPDVTHSLLQKLLRKGLVRINGKKQESSHRLKSGDDIIIKAQIATGDAAPKQTAKPLNSLHLAQDFERMIIFENNDFIVINKPPGLPSQGGTGIKVSVDDMIRSISDRYKLVHRLDRDTSGCLVIGKKTTAAAKFSELLRHKQMQKIYWAMVVGCPEHPAGTIKLALAKKGDKIQKVEVDEAEGKNAITDYTVLERMGPKFSWLELSPITGRMHQLRVHCVAIGCPIIGDGKYGGRESFIQGFENKLHLHARHLIVPELGIDVTAPLPKHMEAYAPTL
jgi:23S rRNA pseudouridine955/2504/2580 synthase